MARFVTLTDSMNGGPVLLDFEKITRIVPLELEEGTKCSSYILYLGQYAFHYSLPTPINIYAFFEAVAEVVAGGVFENMFEADFLEKVTMLEKLREAIVINSETDSEAGE